MSRSVIQPAPAVRLWRAALDGHWLDRSRIQGWSAVALGVQILLLGLFALWANGAFGRLATPPITDFLSFYAAGRQVLAGHALEVYAPAAHAAAEAAANGPGTPYVYFYYPPNFLPWCALLALAPLRLAFVLTEVLTATGLALVIRAILQRPWRSWVLPMAAFPGIAWTVLTGQNAFLVAACIGLFTLWLQRRPALAGVALGFACFKPHLALAAPVALAAGGKWRAFAAAAATVAVWVVAPAALFGPAIWPAYLKLLSSAGTVYETGRVDFADYVTIYGASRLAGATAVAARWAQFAGSAVVMALVAYIWRSPARTPVKFAAFCSALLLSAPMALMYDLTLLTLSIAWLVRDGLGPRSGDRTLLFIAYAAALACRYAGLYAGLPIGPLPAAAILWICIRRSPIPAPAKAPS